VAKRVVRIDSRYRVLSAGYSVPGTRYAACAVPLLLLFASTLWADPTSSPAAHTDAASTIDVPTLLFVFLLATFIGMGVITRVSRLLHTPLMSLTNAISAIAVVGAIGIAGAATTKEHPLYLTILGSIALFASMTNIVSGFLLTDRMVKMFKSQEGGKS
jgi:proton-translocating NAD(P)+ transhydrogenase subunit alpha